MQKKYSHILKKLKYIYKRIKQHRGSRIVKNMKLHILNQISKLQDSIGRTKQVLL